MTCTTPVLRTILLAIVLSLLIPVRPTPVSAADPAVADQPAANNLPAAGETALPSPGAVSLDGLDLFTVKGRILSFTPEERAQAIAGRIARIAGSLTPLDTLGIVEGENGSEIVAGDIIIMTVSAADARAEGVAREQLAGQYLEQIRDAITRYRQQRSAKQLLSGSLYSVAATLLLAVLLLATRWGFRWLMAGIEAQRGRLIRPIRFQQIVLLQEARLVAILRFGLRFLRLALIIVLLDVYVTFVLSMFPWTRGLATRLTGYVLKPVNHIVQSFLAYLPNIFFVAVTVLVTYLAIRCVRFFFTELGKGTIAFAGFQPDWAETSYKLVSLLLIALCLVVIFPYLPGSESPAFRGITVFVGVLLSLGSTSAVANIVAGVLLTYTGAFRLGDRVKIADTVGDVLEKTLLVTRVRTIKNVDITIPNALVLNSHLINYSTSAKAQGLILHTSVTIGYDVPWRKVHDALLAAARGTEQVLPAPEPFVLQTALNDFAVNYELNVYTDQPHSMARVYSALHQKIQDCCNEAGIEIMSPHYTALRDGNQTTIPSDYLAEGYQPPSFRV